MFKAAGLLNGTVEGKWDRKRKAIHAIKQHTLKWKRVTYQVETIEEREPAHKINHSLT